MTSRPLSFWVTYDYVIKNCMLWFAILQAIQNCKQIICLNFQKISFKDIIISKYNFTDIIFHFLQEKSINTAACQCTTINFTKNITTNFMACNQYMHTFSFSDLDKPLCQIWQLAIFMKLVINRADPDQTAPAVWSGSALFFSVFSDEY